MYYSSFAMINQDLQCTVKTASFCHIHSGSRITFIQSNFTHYLEGPIQVDSLIGSSNLEHLRDTVSRIPKSARFLSVFRLQLFFGESFPGKLGYEKWPLNPKLTMDHDVVINFAYKQLYRCC